MAGVNSVLNVTENKFLCSWHIEAPVKSLQGLIAKYNFFLKITTK